jgi:regulator of replication initiation timing
MNHDDPAAHLRQTADLMETAARAIEREKKLESDLKKWKEHLDGEVSRRLMMDQQICGLLPVPADDDARPQFDRLLERLRLANDANRSWDDLILRCDYLKGEVVTADNHASCRLNVLGEIHRILGSDGGTTGVNVLTGVPPDLARLPKRIEQLLADVTTWRERYDEAVIKNGELVRENETLARNMPPEPPAEVTAKPDLVYVGQRWCRSGRTAPDYGVVLNYPEGWVVLCESWMDRETGKLTDIPVPVIDLPEVSGV